MLYGNLHNIQIMHGGPLAAGIVHEASSSFNEHGYLREDRLRQMVDVQQEMARRRATVTAPQQQSAHLVMQREDMSQKPPASADTLFAPGALRSVDAGPTLDVSTS